MSVFRAGLAALVATLVAGGAAAESAGSVTPPQGQRADPVATASASPAPKARPTGRGLPAEIEVGPAVRQMITVSSQRFGSRKAALSAWRRDSAGRWQRVHGPVRAVLGYSGWVVGSKRRQSTGTTPAGVFRLPSAFGRAANPGSHLDYQRVDADDWWPYEPRDPATYNVYQRHKAPRTHWRPDMAERLDSYTRQYAYALVVGFNLPRGVHYSGARHQWVAHRRADTRLGGGIFLHVRGDGQTAGCVAVPRSQMRWLTRWVRPAAHPRIAMGPRHYLVRL